MPHAVPADRDVRARGDVDDRLEPRPVLQPQRQERIRRRQTPLTLARRTPRQIPQQLPQLLIGVRDRSDLHPPPVGEVQPHLREPVDEDVLHRPIVEMGLQTARTELQVEHGLRDRRVLGARRGRSPLHRLRVRPDRHLLIDQRPALLLLRRRTHPGRRPQQPGQPLPDLPLDQPHRRVVDGRRHPNSRPGHPARYGTRPGGSTAPGCGPGTAVPWSPTTRSCSAILSANGVTCGL